MEYIPKQWKEAKIILLHKKGRRDEVQNYRPISLTCAIYKLFAKIILNRLTSQLDSQQPHVQASFRKGYSTTDHLHSMKQVIDKYTNYKKNPVSGIHRL